MPFCKTGREVWLPMKRSHRLVFSLLTLVLTQCGEFSQVFTPPANTSQNTPQSGDSLKEPSRSTKSSVKLPTIAPQTVDVEMPVVRDPILTKQGVYYFINNGDTLSSICKRYRIDPEQLVQINNLVESEMFVGRRLFIPNMRNRNNYVVVTRTIIESAQTKDDQRDKRNVSFQWPVDGIVTSPFGWRRGRNHDGLDISVKVGTPIHAAEDGRVLFAKRFAGYGNLVVLKHAQNYFSAYAHAQSLSVGQGDKVKRGQVIAVVGMTGHSTGPHLHFEIRKGVQAVDPKPLLPAK